MTEVPPFGADNLPIKELEPEKVIKPVQEACGNNIFVVILLAIIILLLAVIVILFIYKNQPPPVVILPSPSAQIIIASPSATPSASFKQVGERLTGLEIDLKQVDLNDPQLVFPILDFSLDLGQKQAQ